MSKQKIISLAVGLSAMLLGTSGCNHSTMRVQARYWAGSTNKLVAFPEQDPDGMVWPALRERPNLGLCFSGGGTRSASASVGQLRALHQLGWMDKARYTAAASGGSWALIPYTFMQSNRLGDFLEDYVAPGGLKECNTVPKPHSLTKAISKANVTARGLYYLARLRGADSYARVISDRFLDPFCLGDEKRWFTWNEDTGAEILKRNKHLAEHGLDQFYAVPPGRPYPIIGGTIRHYQTFATGNNNSAAKRVPVEYTPLYSGVRRYLPADGFSPVPLGGGFVESFAYDTICPVPTNDHLAEVGFYRRGPWLTSPALNLADVVGSSGAAPGEYRAAVEAFGFSKMNHWSPQALHANGQTKDRRLAHQDGGLSENLAIAPLLARKVSRIVAFVNAEERVEFSAACVKFPDYVEALFGIQTNGMYGETQVFESAGLEKLARDLKSSVQNGGPATVLTTLDVKAQPRFGVEPYQVKVLWVFLEAVDCQTGRRASDNWVCRIPTNSPLRLRLEGKKGLLKNFPNYRTFAENRGLSIWPLIQLHADQTTLLAHYTAWTVMESQEKLDLLMNE